MPAAARGMEYGLVTKAGYPFHHIEINGFQRRLNAENIVRNVIALWHLALSDPRTQKILNEVKPDLVIGWAVTSAAPWCAPLPGVASRLPSTSRTPSPV